MPETMPSEVMLYRWYAKTFSWTPQQVRELPLDCFNWFPIIEEAENLLQERLNKEASRSSSQASGPRILGR
jgi:hypothetical protein